tara:strand:+ start:953 stop:1459 length:507 start_codon:yes stop_codon:yes gene_type:complete
MIECNWLRFFSKIGGIKNGDSPTLRMLKSDVVSVVLDKCSNMKYVNDNGNDFVLEDGTRIELKTKKSVFLKKIQKTSNITIMNTRGGAERGKTFDFLLLIQTEKPYRVAYIDWESLQEHITYIEDACVAKSIPYNKLSFIDTDFFDWELEVKPWDLQESVMEMIRSKV